LRHVTVGTLLSLQTVVLTVLFLVLLMDENKTLCPMLKLYISCLLCEIIKDLNYIHI